MTGIWDPGIVYPKAAQCPRCGGVFTFYPGDVRAREGTLFVPCHYCGRDVPVPLYEPGGQR